MIPVDYEAVRCMKERLLQSEYEHIQKKVFIQNCLEICRGICFSVSSLKNPFR